MEKKVVGAQTVLVQKFTKFSPNFNGINFINMNLIYIANARMPTEKAHGHQIGKMCEQFSLLGEKVELWLPTRQNNIEQDLFGYYNLADNFRVKKIRSFDPVFLFGFFEKWYIKFQASFFIISLFFYLLFKKNKSDCLFYTRDEYLLPLLEFFSRKAVWECHALPGHLKFYRRYIIKCAAVITLTKKIKEELIDSGVDGEKTSVSPDAVDLKIFAIDLDKEEARRKLNLPADRIILGYTGSLKTKGMDKGLNDIIKALKLLRADNDKIILAAVGGNSKDIEYYKLAAEEAGVSPNCLFIDKVKQSRLAIYQKAFDVLLMPFPNIKHYAYYMSPLKMFEYLASGRPIISSDLPSIREVLNETNCLFCRPGDPADLAAKIKLILRDNDLVDKITRQALLDVKKYSWEKRAENIIKFISQPYA